MAFQFPIGRKAGLEIEVPNLFGKEVKEEEQPGIINGQQARSILEWRVAKALWKLNLEFFYQYPLYGGTQRRGGYVIDFVVFVAPGVIPLEVQGERWHTGSFASDERRRQAMIESYFGTQMRYVWENQLQTDEDAISAVRGVIL